MWETFLMQLALIEEEASLLALAQKPSLCSRNFFIDLTHEGIKICRHVVQNDRPAGVPTDLGHPWNQTL
jgi:hypothetical protein